jgi:hypothetical protein
MRFLVPTSKKKNASFQRLSCLFLSRKSQIPLSQVELYRMPGVTAQCVAGRILIFSYLMRLMLVATAYASCVANKHHSAGWVHPRPGCYRDGRCDRRQEADKLRLLIADPHVHVA